MRGGQAKTHGADALLESVTIYGQVAGMILCVATPLTVRQVESLLRALQPLVEPNFSLRTPSKVQPNNHGIPVTSIDDIVAWKWPNLRTSDVTRSTGGSWEAPPTNASTELQKFCVLAN